MSASPQADRRGHWQHVYTSKPSVEASWYQTHPTLTLELIDVVGVSRKASIIDVGGGSSVLVDRLLEAGYRDLTVLDLSPAALAISQTRLGDAAPVTWLAEDLLDWQPDRRYDLWHDRAVLHFLSGEDVAAYRELLERSVTPNGCVILGTFAPNGPEQCSGLPVTRYSAADLATLLTPTFTVLADRHERHTTPSGSTQAFVWVAARRVSS